MIVRDLEPGDWAIVERIFGPRGACGGCWCMYWRLRGKAWEEAKGERNRRAFRRLVEGGEVNGCLAFEGEEAVGWCLLARRRELDRLMASRVLTSGDDEAWCVPCFYVPARWRGRGVASALLRGAVEQARRRGAAAVEGYPVVPWKGALPAAFAYVGVPSLFEGAGFRAVPDPPGARPIHRLVLGAEREE